MGKIKVVLFFFVLILLSQTAFGQNRYAVHFKFKPQESFTLSNPFEYLTAGAIDRRTNQNIPIDSLDLPVSQKYIDGIKPFTQEILFKSQWMNAAIVVANEIEVGNIQSLPFVDKVVLAAPGFNPSGRMDNRSNDRTGLKLSLKFRSKKVNTPFDFQNELLGIQNMHEMGFKGKGITVAVFDAGFPGVDNIPALSHLFTNNQIIGSKDFVHTWNDNVFTKNQHGTNVLSLIASDDPQLLLAGAPEANYILCITEEVSTEYRIEEYNWVKAAEYADSLGVDIINSSLGYLDFDDKTMDYTADSLDGETAIITKGATIAANKGILVITSAGNYGSKGMSSLTAPADAKGVLSIGAVQDNLQMAGFSSQGPTADGRIKPELSTYGVGVYLLRPDGSLSRSNGTSFSAPQIAALAAGLWGARPEWSKDELIDNLIKGATMSDQPDNFVGYGIPNFTKSYYGEILEIVNVEKELEWKVYPNPLEGHDLSILFGDQLVGEFALYDLSGRNIYKRQVQRLSNREAFQVNLPGLISGIYVVEMQSGRDLKNTKLIKR
ncbi:hypothetical protein P872_04945 [Rhodonellum psychrophilum GCM71 = DSM 17998]|uniref:Peptidase S8/S53 domain-containing protein n=2 Tax=Rhodonellum TaxID=336827 RepID=U5BYP3_9BACT|nr:MULTISPECIES: S8 family serine peptidase [Rhodonellum]ERM82963.1 hypothetical protein P872_04945 [Rhodonellum psychrophilum GCM71 = DSM 17998]SDZ36531.1 Por secretion system C-terminal sorting domain-containing protein [Rhodonellum ikkaensis]